jgi:hypothetical protein
MQGAGGDAQISSQQLLSAATGEVPIHQGLHIGDRTGWRPEWQHRHRAAFRSHDPTEIRLRNQHKPPVTHHRLVQVDGIGTGGHGIV